MIDEKDAYRRLGACACDAALDGLYRYCDGGCANRCGVDDANRQTRSQSAKVNGNTDAYPHPDRDADTDVDGAGGAERRVAVAFFR